MLFILSKDLDTNMEFIGQDSGVLCTLYVERIGTSLGN